MPSKPQVNKSLVARFQAYRDATFRWGALGHVLANRRLTDNDVDFTVETADQAHDREALALARILRNLSEAQRERLWQALQKS